MEGSGRLVKGSGRMIRVTGVGRRILIGSVGLCAVALGWLLLYEVTSPGVAAKLTTAPLAAVLALQVMPVLGWIAWRMDRSMRTSCKESATDSTADAESVSEHSVDVAVPTYAPRLAAAVEVVPVHRVVHVVRARHRASNRGVDEKSAL